MSKIIVYALAWLGLMLVSCGRDKLDPVSYKEWFRTHKDVVVKKKEIGGYVLEVIHKTPEYIAIKESGEKLEPEELKTRITELQGMHYFDLRIGMKNGKDFIEDQNNGREDMYAKLNFFSFEFQKNILLTINGKDYPCDLYHFERSYDLSKARTFVLGFKVPEEEANVLDDRLLTIDTGPLSVGTIKIRFDKKELNTIPELIIR